MSEQRRNRLPSRWRLAGGQDGFTLIELILVMALLAILGLMGAEFISQAFKGVAETDNRAAIYEEGSLALIRLERELRNVLPNAVQVEPGRSGLMAGLLAETAMECPDGVDPQNCVFGQYIDKDPTGKKFLRDRTDPLPAGSVVSIYNRNWLDFSNPDPASRRLYLVTGVVAASNMMRLDRPVIAASPDRRFYAVERAVRYFLENGTLKRASRVIDAANYLSPLVFPAGAPLATDLTSLSFVFQPGSLTSSGLVIIDFTITRDNQPVSFHKEVQIRNVP